MLGLRIRATSLLLSQARVLREQSQPHLHKHGRGYRALTDHLNSAARARPYPATQRNQHTPAGTVQISCSTPSSSSSAIALPYGTMPTRSPTSFPPGHDKHHVVILEGVHAPPPDLPFPHTLTTYPLTHPSEVAQRIRDATIVIACVTPILPSHLDLAPYLGCVAIMAVGISWVDKPSFAAQGVTVTNCPGGNREAVAEHVLALYFGLRKRVGEVDSVIRGGGEWRGKGTLTGLWGRDEEGGRVKAPLGVGQEVLGILGYGNVGRQVAKVAKGVRFGEVLVAERKGVDREKVREGRTLFEDVIRNASTIIACVPLGEDTVGLIGEEELKMMRQDAVVINVARGGVVDEAALARALREKWITGAATDVFIDEPAGKGTSPLLPDIEAGEEKVPNLVVSPHIAWFTQSTIANYRRMLQEGIEGYINDALLEKGKEDGGLDKINPLVAVHHGRVWR